MSYNQNIKSYDRDRALAYSHHWVFGRNPDYYDFSYLGGDCTNFISQCLYAGSQVMNYNRDTGWYYNHLNDRSPAWTGVPFLYRFLIRNTNSPGPFGEKVNASDIEPGDIIQLAFTESGEFGHSLFVVQRDTPAILDNILINTHTDDQQNYPLSEYYWNRVRFIKILGVHI